jgi:hypothetical protein
MTLLSFLRLISLALSVVSPLHAQVRFVPHAIPVSHASAGALVNGRALYSWGEGLSRVSLPPGRSQLLRKEKFGPAGCAGDIDSDGVTDLVLHALPDRMVWVKGPAFQTMHTIDTGASFADCVVTTVLGHRGVLITHRGMQVRFYEPPSRPSERWPYREIYSFYTASYQAGLVEHDVDGDERTDLIAGNYWIQAPPSFELPWRLFAINTYNDTPQAAHVRIARGRNGALIVSQGELHPAKLAVFERLSDPKQLWRETRLDRDMDLNEPAALAAADDSGDFVLAERGGMRPRTWWWTREPDGAYHRSVIHQGVPVHSVFLKDLNADRRLDVILVGPSTALWLENVPVK